MKTFFLLIFFKTYAFAEFLSKDKLYHFTAMYLTALLIFFNCITAYVYLGYLFHIQVGHGNSIFPSKASLLILAFSIVGVIYLTVVRGDRYKFLQVKFEEHQTLKGPWGTLLSIVYVIITLALLISVAWLKSAKK
jgi:hypothetical protein